ncbi:hypothetical protein IFR05_004827 [Cadophora sp. M221]|nr:hypothetical protein IFR05_004827 [Cadophora sp. M221]
MSKSFTFGVELEMMVAFVLEGEEKPDSTETRIVVFPSNDEPRDPENESRHTGEFPPAFYKSRIIAEFKRTIGKGGFPVASTETDTSGWAVVGDTSLNHPTDTEEETEDYDWCGIEVKTPALPFTPQSLQAVKDVCTLIQQRFKTLQNTTTGLHVHIGHGKSCFSTHDVSKIMAFIYAFEPQLSSLHPVHRYSHMYGHAMRHNCNFSQSFQRRHGVMPSALMAVTKILTTIESDMSSTRRELADLVSSGSCGKNGNYNFNGLEDRGVNAEVPTLEFRQHEGTMDGELVVQWVQLLVGMLKFIEDEEYASFAKFLFDTAEKEKWQKVGDEKDAKREASMGPTLADGEFTVIDLLRYIGLNEQADYFKDRVHKHDIPPYTVPVLKKVSKELSWEYRKEFEEGVGMSAEPETNDQLRKYFQGFQGARLAAKMEDDGWTLAENSRARLWSVHSEDSVSVEDSDEISTSLYYRR